MLVKCVELLSDRKWCPSEPEKLSRRLRPRMEKIYMSPRGLHHLQRFTIFAEALEKNKRRDRIQMLGNPAICTIIHILPAAPLSIKRNEIICPLQCWR